MNTGGTWRTTGDTVERLEELSQKLLRDGGWGDEAPEQIDPIGPASSAVVAEILNTIRPIINACGPDEGSALLAALDGRAVAPGPSGAPTRGRLDVLPTGKNFYSVDSRAVPTPTAWKLGWKSANLLI